MTTTSIKSDSDQDYYSNKIITVDFILRLHFGFLFYLWCRRKTLMVPSYSPRKQTTTTLFIQWHEHLNYLVW